MESMSMDTMNDGKNEEKTMPCNIENLEFKKGRSLVSKKCTKKLEAEQTLILDVRRSRVSATHTEFFFQNIHGLHNSIPKHITSFDENYALRCLELIRNFAIRAAAWNFTPNVDVLSGDVSRLTEIRNRSTYEMARLAIECPLAFGSEAILNSTGEWTIGTVTRSQSMINILKSPLLQQFGYLDCDVNFGRTSLLDVGEPVCSDFVDSPQGLSSKLSHELQKDVAVLDHKYAPAPMHKRVVSVSSTNSSCSDHSSSSASTAMYQGMLQSTWKDGLPHYVFTLDDKREVYAANSSKVESLDDKVLDYVYTFHSRKNAKKECNTCELDLETFGKMRVSNSIRVCSDTSEVLETRFVLSVSRDNHLVEMQTSNHTLKKNKKLTAKVVKAFRSSHSYKQRLSSKFGGSSTIFEDTSSNPSEEVHNTLDSGDASAENKFMQNFESAAIIVKDLIFKEADLGGWGMKFLKKSGNNTSLQTSMPSRCTQKFTERSTTIDILIPAGFHGGPRTRNGGPSSLIERWISGGSCDCGGWDVGCPLTILNTKSSSTDSLPLADNSEDCKPINLFIQGSKQDVPIMKMVNIHDGLYYIHFQSTLSVLQSFAIAAAILHSRSPVLRSKVCRS